MNLMPDDIRARLLANGAAEEGDRAPVVKFFDPCGAATWLITEIIPYEPDILFGLCDLGMKCPELGTVRLSELQAIKRPYGLGIERDLNFRPRFTLSVYAEAARVLGRITEGEQWLVAAARRLGLPDNPELPPDFAAVNPRI
jgi:hypothetical protein